jgi:hypothetical protein
MLSDRESHLYMNSILLKYLYERVAGGDIGIVKAVHDNNLAQKNISFHKNITKSVLDQTGREWAAALNGFHAESYFTGARARPWAFISDAKLMGTWKAPTTATGADTTVNVSSYSMGLFMYKPQPYHNDTLALLISGQKESAAGSAAATWGASAIVTERVGDSARIIPITIDKNGTGRLLLADWKGMNGCLLVATNAGQSARRVTVRIVDPGDTTTSIDPIDPDDSARSKALKIFPNTVKLRELKPIRIAGGDVSNVKIITQDGKVLASYDNRKSINPSFVFSDDTVKWFPGRRRIPGVYFISASSTNPATGKKSALRRKIILLP